MKNATEIYGEIIHDDMTIYEKNYCAHLASAMYAINDDKTGMRLSHMIADIVYHMCQEGTVRNAYIDTHNIYSQ